MLRNNQTQFSKTKHLKAKIYHLNEFHTKEKPFKTLILKGFRRLLTPLHRLHFYQILLHITVFKEFKYLKKTSANKYQFNQKKGQIKKGSIHIVVGKY
jgi:hypothetical protein